MTNENTVFWTQILVIVIGASLNVVLVFYVKVDPAWSYTLGFLTGYITARVKGLLNE